MPKTSGAIISRKNQLSKSLPQEKAFKYLLDPFTCKTLKAINCFVIMGKSLTDHIITEKQR